MLTVGGRCWLCQLPLAYAQHGICSYCLRHLPPRPICCPRCGLSSSRADIECGRCLQHPPPWQSLLFVSDYQQPLSQLVNQLKFASSPQLAPLLARLILLRWLECYRSGQLCRPQHLLAVPLHRRRFWWRGYNQSELLAQPLARWLGCHYQPTSLLRTRATPSQRELNALQRKRNLRGAFLCQQNLEHCHVALLDDVITTGSTVSEITKLLLEQGVASVQVWCVCRTL